MMMMMMIMIMMMTNVLFDHKCSTKHITFLEMETTIKLLYLQNITSILPQPQPPITAYFLRMHTMRCGRILNVAVMGGPAESPTTHKQSSYICSILLCLGMHHILYSTKLT